VPSIRSGKYARPEQALVPRSRLPHPTCRILIVFDRQEAGMANRDPRVDAYIEKAAPFARPILRHLRKAVHAACPGVEEAIKWSVPSFEYKGPFCGMAAFKAHVTFGFWKASLLTGAGVPNPDAKPMAQFGSIRSVADLPDDKTLRRVLAAAIALNDAGVKPYRKAPVKHPPIRLPAPLKTALAGNARAKAAFDAFSPSHKREYIAWIVEAKGEDTRARRVAQAILWMAEGKSRNWKYERR
jgi:uncharacterized protein YdeI (YjbR/CyaY-like superfamily)